MTLFSILGLAGLSASIFCSWAGSPISVANIQHFGTAQVITLQSCLIISYSLGRRSVNFIAALGFCCLAFCGYFLLSLAVNNPLFWDLVDENNQFSQINSFSSLYLPPNLGSLASFNPDAPTVSLTDRLLTSLYLMGGGWWLCLSGSIALLAASTRGKNRGRRYAAGLGLAITAILLGGALQGGVAQYHQDRADQYMAAGNYLKATLSYEAAITANRQLAGSTYIHQQIGKARHLMHEMARAETFFYIGERSFQAKEYGPAIASYRVARTLAAPSLGKVITRRIVWSHVLQGLSHLKKSEIDQAASCWESALREDPIHFQAIYYLARALYVQGRYEQSIAFNKSILARSTNPLLNANIFANMGDAYWKLQQFANAREMYEASEEADSDQNLRMFKCLGGT